MARHLAQEEEQREKERTSTLSQSSWAQKPHSQSATSRVNSSMGSTLKMLGSRRGWPGTAAVVVGGGGGGAGRAPGAAGAADAGGADAGEGAGAGAAGGAGGGGAGGLDEIELERRMRVDGGSMAPSASSSAARAAADGVSGAVPSEPDELVGRGRLCELLGRAWWGGGASSGLLGGGCAGSCARRRLSEEGEGLGVVGVGEVVGARCESPFEGAAGGWWVAVASWAK